MSVPGPAWYSASFCSLPSMLASLSLPGEPGRGTGRAAFEDLGVPALAAQSEAGHQAHHQVAILRGKGVEHGRVVRDGGRIGGAADGGRAEASVNVAEEPQALEF